MTGRCRCAIFATLLLLFPVSAWADLFKPAVKDQIGLGKRAAAQIEKEEKIVRPEDTRVQNLRALGNELVALIPPAERKKKPFEYTFNLIESKELNAFALPGGPIYIYSGLLEKLQTQDQLAGILAHELTHVHKEHWAGAYADNQKRKLGLAVILTVLNANDTLFNAASVSDALIFELPYSRKHESESDTYGFDLMAKAGYSPQGMVDVFEVLKKKSGSGRNTEWVSDHPSLDGRIKKIRDRMTKSGKTYPDQRPLKG